MSKATEHLPNRQAFLASIKQFPKTERYILLFSGGMDSRVLLQLAHAARKKLKQVLVLHVHHGLHEEADAWALSCADTCAELKFDFKLIKLGELQAGSLEAAARKARYQAVASIMQPGDVVLTAHHQDDQVETFMLRLLRGAGTAGLAAMPAQRVFAKGFLCRPLLGYRREQLAAYAKAYQLSWIEDPSNRDEAHNRNYLRHRLLPELNQRWPANAAVAASQQHCASDAELINDLASIDYQQVATTAAEVIKYDALLLLKPKRAVNLLRWWCQRLGYQAPAGTRLLEFLRQLSVAGRAASPSLALSGAATLRVYKAHVYCVKPLPGSGQLDWQSVLDTNDTTKQRILLPHGLGHLQLMPSAKGQRYLIRFRQAGDRLQLNNQGHSTAFKAWCQQQGVLPWVRHCLPLLLLNEQIVAVADLSAAAMSSAVISWERDFRVIAVKS